MWGISCIFLQNGRILIELMHEWQRKKEIAQKLLQFASFVHKCDDFLFVNYLVYFVYNELAFHIDFIEMRLQNYRFLSNFLIFT